MSGIDQLMELSEAGDARAVRRLYAQLLKQTRPDDDAEAFQHLHATYQEALARCASPHREEVREEVRAPLGAPPAPGLQAQPSSSAPLPPRPVVAEAPQPAPFDPERALSRMLARADRATSAEVLRQHLQLDMLHWPLQGQDRVGAALWHALRDDTLACAGQDLWLIVEALGWEDVESGIDPALLDIWIARAHGRWLQEPRNWKALGQQLEPHMDAKSVPAALRRLQQPSSRLRNLIVGFSHTRAQQQVRLLELLGWRGGWPLPADVDRGQADFWLQRTSFNSMANIQLSLLRCSALSVLFMLCVVVARHLSGLPLATTGLLWAGGLPLLSWAGWTLYNTLLAWQCRADRHDERYPALRRWFLPLALLPWSVMAALVIHWDMVTPFLLPTWITLGVLLRVAWMRAGMRRDKLLPFNIPIAVVVFGGVLLIVPGAVLVLVYWGLDLWYQRRPSRR